jgi:hypothetical protein
MNIYKPVAEVLLEDTLMEESGYSEECNNSAAFARVLRRWWIDGSGISEQVYLAYMGEPKYSHIHRKQYA